MFLSKSFCIKLDNLLVHKKCIDLIKKPTKHYKKDYKSVLEKLSRRPIKASNHFPPVTATGKSEYAFLVEPNKLHSSFMLGEAGTEILLTTSWQHLYFVARSENIKHNKTTVLHKGVLYLFASGSAA